MNGNIDCIFNPPWAQSSTTLLHEAAKHKKELRLIYS
jgi:hypothetical protein